MNYRTIPAAVKDYRSACPDSSFSSCPGSDPMPRPARDYSQCTGGYCPTKKDPVNSASSQWI